MLPTHVHAAGSFADVARGKWRREFPNFFYAFGPQRNTLKSYGSLLKYFRRKLLKFE